MTTILPAVRARFAAALTFNASALRPVLIDGCSVGMVDARRASRLQRFTSVFDVYSDAVCLRPTLATCAARTAALDTVARTLADEGELSAWRDERYAVAANLDAAPLCLLERAAARYFGIHTQAVHVNGATSDAAGATLLWLARRSAAKAIDPGMLDNLVGGGVSADLSAQQTLVKESWEEAGITSPLAATATAASTLQTLRTASDGVQHETLFTYDLQLPPGFVPVNQDGEAGDHRAVTQAQAAALLPQATGAEAMTIDAGLVTFDWLVRTGYWPHAHPDVRAIAAMARHAAGLAQ